MNLNQPFSKKFIERFEIVVLEYFYYNKYHKFHIVPSFLEFTSTISYLPILSYTDIEYKDVQTLLKETKNFKYIVKVLNPNYKEFKQNDTVTMRLDISSHNFEYIMQNHIESRCRTYIRKSYKENLTLKKGNDKKLIVDFYTLYSKSMHTLGSPAYAIEFFNDLAHVLKDDVDFFICYKDEKPIYTTCILYDDNIAWSGWVGRDNNYSSSKAGYYLFSEAIKVASIQKKKTIFDFGRSGYLSGTYTFKKKFGAIPIKIDLITNMNKGKDIYSKYKFASMLWRYIPFKIANKLGNIIVRYLAEY